jgi:hypothetical protein
MKTYNLLEQSFIIKIIGTSDEDIKHSWDICEMILS